MTYDLLDDIEIAEIPVAANGHAMGVCFGCGGPVGLRKGSARLWCPTCKAAGKPAAQRARDFRASKSKVQA